MPTYIISGATGNLGRNLRRELEVFGRVEPIERQDLSPKKIYNLFEKTKGEKYFIHLAWPIKSVDFRSNRANLEMLELSKKILLVTKSFDIKILAAGSILEAGDVPVINDKILANPQNIYAETKCKLHEFIQQNFQDRFKWLRIANQISAFDSKHKLTPTLLSSQRKTVEINAANNEVDAIHVSDVARAFTHSALKFHSLPSEIVVGTGQQLQIATFAKMFYTPNIVLSNVSEPSSVKTNPAALSASGWNAKNLTAKQLYEAVIQEQW
jgi:nucleoside-diphosphate-sugar epimerase